MSDGIDVPDLAIVRALTAGGPYLEGDVISVAFTAPTVGRLVAHPLERNERGGTAVGLLPETLSAHVLHGAGPYASGDVVTLSFVDPAIARIHPAARAERTATLAEGAAAPAAAPAVVPAAPALVPAALDVLPAAAPTEAERPVRGVSPLHAVPHGVRLSLTWNADRVRRFVQVTDKLFTVDRLGWYRHVFAMRLLVPDAIACGDPDVDVAAMRQLRALRAATLETLGRPLLAAFMPSFSVTPQWLDTIDSVETAKALSGLRAAIAPFASDAACVSAVAADDETQGVIGESELVAAPATSVEALLPLLVPDTSRFDDVTLALRAYRSALVELFGQTAQSAESVRLNQMAQPNHPLDDRLWTLVGVVSERFGAVAVA